MKTVHTVAALRAEVAALRAHHDKKGAKRGGRVAFVPTMGNLHRGHVRLVERARELADAVVASVFVNPLQFGPSEDFEKYPRTLADDAAKLAAAGCALLYAPSVDEMYPGGREHHAVVTVPGLSDILCGQFRPGHFSGVATVVAKLFGQVQPDVAVFGEKDYQQLLVVRRMARDLALPVEVIGEPTVREPDGLALSSRNQYLKPDERERAAALFQTLAWAVDELRAGKDLHALESAGMERLKDAGFRPDYVAVRDAADLGPPRDGAPRRVLAAAWLGQARLIDNLPT